MQLGKSGPQSSSNNRFSPRTKTRKIRLPQSKRPDRHWRDGKRQFDDANRLSRRTVRLFLPLQPFPFLPSRLLAPAELCARRPRTPAGRPASKSRTPSTATGAEPTAVEIAYETVDRAPETGDRITDALYEQYRLQSIRIPGSPAHPTRLVQSAAMASVAAPKPSYRPHLPPAVIWTAYCPTPSLRVSSMPGRHIPRTLLATGRAIGPSMSVSPLRPVPAAD